MNNGTVGLVRDIVRILVPAGVVGVWLYLVVTGAVDVQDFTDLAAPLLAGYFALDGVARVTAR